MRKYYKCKFLSDVVLPASANSQGNVAFLDFIAGSSFLGMVARKYESFGKKSFDVFHSGAVSFGDAHLIIDEQVSYKVPLSFHKLKLEDSYYNRLHLSKSEEKALREAQKQLKQIREGFINENLSLSSLEYNYLQKSKYNTTTRTSEDGGMYGYSALSAGLEWGFGIEYRDESLIESVETVLLGKQRLGKSKSTEYGAVFISTMQAPQELKSFTPKDDLTYIYFNSRAVTELSIEALGLSRGEIVWQKSFVNSGSYTPYNYKRQGYDASRVYVEKGSVVTLKGIDLSELSSRVGAYQSEGFGEILINPAFLEIKEPQLQSKELRRVLESDAKQGKKDTNLINFLTQKVKEEEEKFEVAAHVQEVYEKLMGPSKSQWGEIRSFATTAKSPQELEQKIAEYIDHGIAKTQWEGVASKLFSEMHNSTNPLAFVKLLAMIVSKHTKAGEES